MEELILNSWTLMMTEIFLKDTIYYFSHLSMGGEVKRNRWGDQAGTEKKTRGVRK